MTKTKLVLGLLAAVLLAGCSETAEGLRKKGDQFYLARTVGKPYADVAQAKALAAGELLPVPAYGTLIGQQTLPSGDIVYKYAKKREAEESSTDFAGLIGSSKTTLEYAISYFRVGADGRVKDVANGIAPGEKVSCINFVGGLVSSCGNAGVLSQDLSYLDTVVRTSSGTPYSAWQ